MKDLAARWGLFAQYEDIDFVNVSPPLPVDKGFRGVI